MAAFDEIDWRAPDAWGIVACQGVLSVLAVSSEACSQWLEQHGYAQYEFNFSNGISSVVSALGKHFRWLEQFGYSLSPESRSLDALRDGFEITEDKVVFKLVSFEQAWLENANWASGFLAIVSEHSLYQLAVGKRFFAMLPIQPESVLVGKPIEKLTLGSPFRFRLGEA